MDNRNHRGHRRAGYLLCLAVVVVAAVVSAYEVKEISDEEWELRQKQNKLIAKQKNLEEKQSQLEDRINKQDYERHQAESWNNINRGIQQAEQSTAMLVKQSKTRKQANFYITFFLVGSLTAIFLPIVIVGVCD